MAVETPAVVGETPATGKGKRRGKGKRSQAALEHVMAVEVRRITFEIKMFSSHMK